MIFNTWTFAVFAILALTGYQLVPQRLRPVYLVIAGSIFYAWSVPGYLVLIAGLGLATYGTATLMLSPRRSPSQRRALLIFGVVLMCGVLAFFKYAAFFMATVDAVARQAILPIPRITVPLAISFFTFEFVHVLVDVYLGKIRRLDALEFGVFTLFFPTLVAGPIKRYESFAPQVRMPRYDTRADIARNMYRIVIGLAKKYVIADSMTLLTQPLLTPGAPFGRLDDTIAVLAYTMKIYFDFTGYSDIAIGVAALLGFTVPENFDRPYRSLNMAQFWRRWHISLSSWIRDYIFIPLGGSRRAPLITALNLLIAMALAGLWHGAAWTFLAWGVWHGSGLAAHRLWSALVLPRAPWFRRGGPIVRALSVATTFTFVAFGWVLFASTSLSNAAATYRAILTP